MARKDSNGNKEPSFCKTYDSTFHMYLIMTHQEILIVTYLASIMKYDNSVVLDSNKKRTLISLLGTTDGTFRYCISSLIKKKVLFKGEGRGVYTINPTFMFKGSIEQRSTLMMELGLGD